MKGGRIMKKMLSVLLTVLLSFTTTVNCFTLVSADQLTIKNVSDNVAESFLNSLDTNLEIQEAEYRTLFWDIEIKPGSIPSAIWALSRVTIS